MNVNELSMLYLTLPIIVSLLLVCTICLAKMHWDARDMRNDLRVMSNAFVRGASVTVQKEDQKTHDVARGLRLVPGKKDTDGR